MAYKSLTASALLLCNLQLRLVRSAKNKMYFIAVDIEAEVKLIQSEFLTQPSTHYT
jgi:hypothetical protein